MIDIRKPVTAILLAASVGGWLGAAAAQAQTLKVAMGSDVKIVDPIWTTAYIQRDFGYMVWDVLFAMDETLAVRPQMVDTWEVSPDKLLWTFTLRDLVWSNGQPVTSGDCIASIKRWGARDSMGRKMMASVDGFETVDARTFRMKMKEPYGLVLESLGKPSSSPAFMMPKKTADTDPNTQIKVEDVIGSGPFTFKADEWKPGEKVVFLRNGGYRPRSEPPSGLAGGKVAKVERVEWIWIPDAQTQVAALGNGEIDIIQAPPHDLLPILSQDRNAKLFDSNPLGSQYEFRFNTLFKPFDDPRIRHAAMVAFGQEEFLKATIGDPKYYKVCKAPFVCGTPLGSDEGMKDVLNQDAARAGDRRRGDDESRAGRQGTARGRRLQGRHAADILNPVSANLFNASCDKATYGWPCDAEIEKLRDAFARETDPAKQKQIAMELQKRWVEAPTFVDLGQLYQPSALRTNIDGMLAAPATVFWNITKK